MTDNDPVDGVLDGATDVWLGTNAGFETAQPFSSDATGDTYDDAITFGGNSGQFPLAEVPGADYPVNIVLNGNASGDVVYYGMWIDWDNDGAYDNFYSGSGVTSSPVTVTETVTAPVGFMADVVNVRLRADDDFLVEADSIGGKTNGEIEDYQAAIVLPVELTSLKGQAVDCDVKLNWTSATEENFSYYQIEWSSDGREFNAIKQVYRTENSSFDLHYQFTHQEAANLNYYRLRMVDLDGSFNYSRIIAVETACINQQIELFPNPIMKGSGNLSVEFDAFTDQTQIVIADMLGRNIKKLSIGTIKGEENSIVLNVSDLPSGTYMMKLSSSKNTYKFIIQE